MVEKARRKCFTEELPSPSPTLYLRVPILPILQRPAAQNQQPALGPRLHARPASYTILTQPFPNTKAGSYLLQRLSPSESHPDTAMSDPLRPDDHFVAINAKMMRSVQFPSSLSILFLIVFLFPWGSFLTGSETHVISRLCQYSTDAPSPGGSSGRGQRRVRRNRYRPAHNGQAP